MGVRVTGVRRASKAAVEVDSAEIEAEIRRLKEELKGHEVNRVEWTPKKDAVLLALWHCYSQEHLAEKLGCSRKACASRMRKLTSNN